MLSLEKWSQKLDDFNSVHKMPNKSPNVKEAKREIIKKYKDTISAIQ